MRHERSEKVRVFLGEIADVCRRYGLSISHEEERSGDFIIEEFRQDNVDCLNRASEDIRTEGNR